MIASAALARRKRLALPVNQTGTCTWRADAAEPDRSLVPSKVNKAFISRASTGGLRRSQTVSCPSLTPSLGQRSQAPQSPQLKTTTTLVGSIRGYLDNGSCGASGKAIAPFTPRARRRGVFGFLIQQTAAFPKPRVSRSSRLGGAT
jgi:hypothetical protein